MSARSAGAHSTDSCHCPRPAAAEAAGWHPSPPARPRDALVSLLVLGLIVSCLFGYVLGSRGIPIGAEPRAVIHTITQDCVSAEDMARAYGFEGDWREYSFEIRRLNQWERWPTLHLGDRVIVPDYRMMKSRRARYGGRAGRSAESRQPDRLLDRGGPPATAGA